MPGHDLVDEVNEHGWGTDDLMEHAFVGPEDAGTTEVILDPEIESHNGRIDTRNGTDYLMWEYEGVTVAVSNEGFGEWRAELSIPEDIAEWLHGPGGTAHTIKSQFSVTVGDHQIGYIDEVWRDQEATRGVFGSDVPPTRLVVRTADNHQPYVCIRSLIDDLAAYAEDAERSAEQMEDAFKAAKEHNE